MPTKKKNKKTQGNSWRSLRQTGRNRALSQEAIQRRRKIALKTFLGFLSLACFVGIVFWCIHIADTNPRALQLGSADQAVKHIYLETDGVLNDAWLAEVMPIARGTWLSHVDIVALDRLLESHGQVRKATVRRVYPDALRVTLYEHSPVMRMRIKSRNETLLVSETGDVFRSDYYSPATVDALPFVAGLKLIARKDGFAPVAGVPIVAELLEKTRVSMPDLYADWLQIMLDRFDERTDAPWSSIKVRTRRGWQITFRPHDFDQQLNRLTSILSTIEPERYDEKWLIDLTPEDRAAVRVAGSDNNHIPNFRRR